MAKNRKLGRAERRELKAELRVLLADGVPDQELADDLGVSQRTLRLLRNELLSDEVTAVSGDTAGQAFVRYKIRREGCIADLDAVIKRAGDDIRALSSIVAAVKVKTQILDSIDEKGQKLGLIPSAPAPGEEFDGIPVDQISNEDLVDKKRGKFKLLEKYKAGGSGGGDYTDMDDEPLYSDVPVRSEG